MPWRNKCDCRPNPVRVLVVDDDEDLRTVIKYTLELHGYEVDEAANGKEALEMLDSERCPYACALVDLLMPEMNGAELAKKAREQHTQLPIMFVSAADPTLLEGMPIEYGSGFIRKPFEIDELLSAVNAMTGKAKLLKEVDERSAG